MGDSPKSVSLDEGLEEKVRHVRTPEGARKYGKPIGSPITAADRALAAAGGKRRESPTSPRRSSAVNLRPQPGAQRISQRAPSSAVRESPTTPRIEYRRPDKYKQPKPQPEVSTQKSQEDRLAEISGSKGSLSDRINSYRDLLPESSLIGERKNGSKTERDIASDGGPGEDTMRQHDVVLQAGRDLSDELNRRIEARLKEQGADTESLDRRLEAARAEVARITESRQNGDKDSQDRAASSLGFGSEKEMRSALLRGDEGARNNYRKMMAEAAKLGDSNRQQELDRAVAEARKVEVERQNQQKLRASAQRDEALKLLTEVRKMNDGSDENGFDLNIVSGFPSEMKRTIRTAESRYPQDWIDRLKANAGNSLKVGENERGYYDFDKKELMVSRGPIGTSDGKALDAVAVHELGHGMEAAIPGLVAMQDAFLWSRTSEGDVGDRKRTGPKLRIDGEVTYADDFKDAYTGKVYNWDSRELFTTQMESLFAGSGYEDEGTRAWTLGVLSML